MDAHSIPPGDLLSTRLLLLRDLTQSLEISKDALAHNDAELIARGAAHQAELCRQWSLLEDQLRHKPQPVLSEPAASAHIELEFTALTTRIRHLTRVHCSLLRHLQRSLAIVGHLVAARAPTYSPELNLVRDEPRPQAGA
jgi:hypothetical protein